MAHKTTYTTQILPNYDGYLTTEKMERKTYDGTQTFVVFFSSILTMYQPSVVCFAKFRRALIKNKKILPAKTTVVI